MPETPASQKSPATRQRSLGGAGAATTSGGITMTRNIQQLGRRRPLSRSLPGSRKAQSAEINIFVLLNLMAAPFRTFETARYQLPDGGDRSYSFLAPEPQPPNLARRPLLPIKANLKRRSAREKSGVPGLIASLDRQVTPNCRTTESAENWCLGRLFRREADTKF